jgi:myo-inositol-1-phosphate synthase
VLEELGVFFKAPQMSNGAEPEHAWPEQERRFRDWLDNGTGRAEKSLKAAAASLADVG